ncbi:MAG TPA: hypothetical protein VF131_05985 [Blastocatellia bacterium]|nr:hypothetical protein [Blastocatellia bacterium]
MKTLACVLLSFLFLNTAVAQQSPDESSIIVVKNSWSKMRYRPGWDRQSVPERYGNPSDPNSLDPGRVNREMAAARRRLSRVIEGYVYKATFKNTSSKTVVLIGWAYTFIEPEDKKETGHQFVNKIKIKKGQKKEVSAFIAQPPTRTVSAQQANNEIEGKVKVNFIKYEDGTVWRER